MPSLIYRDSQQHVVYEVGLNARKLTLRDSPHRNFISAPVSLLKDPAAVEEELDGLRRSSGRGSTASSALSGKLRDTQEVYAHVFSAWKNPRRDTTSELYCSEVKAFVPRQQ